ncbi:MAG: transcriptional regulator [Chlamydiae bacterium CG10_big_fil_rev_8_21_14_0_10_35_9]|nr:MAG: transcriptional regulator [Chlamydiae bacterium CG10_big_fil_rev_8_21_14_0_10_35_9]
MKNKPLTRADPFKIKRKRDLIESAEDYTELIQDLIRNKGEARVCDLAKHLGVSHVTVIRTLSRLELEGYLKNQTRGPIFLTKKGDKLAHQSKKKHETLLKFLLKLGVSQATAENDVEGIEHHISQETLSKISEYLQQS